MIGDQALETLIAAVLVAILAAGVAFALAPQLGALGALGRIVDRSIGMWLVRRVTRRGSRGHPDGSTRAAGPGDGSPPADEIAYRIGMPDAPEPVRPDRLVVGGALGERPTAVRRRRLRDPAVLLVGASALVLAVGVAVPRLPRSEVLDAVDAARFPAQVTLSPGPASTDTAAASESPRPSESDDPPPSAAPTDLPSGPPTNLPSAALTPTQASPGASAGPSTPAPTTAPTALPSASPPATPRPTPAPTPVPTALPTPTPTPPPPIVTPSPTPPPPIAAIDCDVSGFTVSCTSAGSQNGASYSWSFEAGPTTSGVTALHTYDLVGDYVVTLTVTNAIGQTDTQSTVARVI